MRSPRAIYLERVRRLCRADASDRYAVVACRARLYKRGASGLAEPDYWLPTYYGGTYDRLVGRYLDDDPPAEQIVEVPVHSGQLRLLDLLGDNSIRRILGLGAPGGGKTEGLVRMGQILCARRANSIGGVVAPTSARLEIVWKKFLRVLEPLGWVDEVSLGDQEILLRNGTLLQFRSAKRQSEAVGSPIAGHDWHWALEDEQQNIDDDSCREVDARGRVTKHYKVFSSATNDPIHEFQVRQLKYRSEPSKRLITFSGLENVFTPVEHWEALKAEWSPEDYKRFIECKDVPREGRVYPAFSYSESVSSLPVGLRDVTSDLCQTRHRLPFKWIVGFDPGISVCASVIIRAFAGRTPDERIWYVHDEVTTRETTTDFHAQALLRWCTERGIRLDDVIVLMDPAHNDKETDRSDLLLMRAAGFNVFRSNGGDKIERRHRISMVNALLRDATERRRLFLERTPSGTPRANKTAESLGSLMYRATGEIEFHGKTYLNVAHWSDALGYALFNFERVKGSIVPRQQETLATRATEAWQRRIAAQ